MALTLALSQRSNVDVPIESAFMITVTFDLGLSVIIFEIFSNEIERQKFEIENECEGEHDQLDGR